MYCVILVTTASIDEAEKISKHLLAEKLIACANIVKDINSLFWWKGNIDHACEVMLVMKTKQDLVPKVVSAVKILHSYEVPEVIALPIIDGNEDYFQWIDESVVAE